MWTIRSERLANCRGVHFAIDRGGRAATFTDVVAAWQSDADFRTWFNDLLAGVEFESFRWETPAVTTAKRSQPFEFVALDNPRLAPVPDPHAFSEHFQRTDAHVVAFANLGGDAILVVPRPLAEASCYGHLASFVRHAPAAQRDLLWRVVGQTLANHISDKPLWLSTAGAGVSWLHVRLDDRPKYYAFAPYRR